MYKHYAVTFLPAGKRRPVCELVYAKSVHQAKAYFNEIYRHGEYIILAVTEMPTEWEEG